ncbi:hypothetical protein ACQHIV_20405 [Kribbella sp. GL6]|uniref:hypothetical protein n=1 Tax=Kribbella sp. GL6 TaxID=3419765 RepID=UPI003D028AA3
MPDIDMYWLTDPTVPFATFLGVLDTYYNPEIRNDQFEKLVRRAQRDRPDDVEMAAFKTEFVRLLQGDREGLRPGAIDTAAEYDDFDTDDEFLAWLWHELYPNEPLPTPE